MRRNNKSSIKFSQKGSKIKSIISPNIKKNNSNIKFNLKKYRLLNLNNIMNKRVLFKNNNEKNNIKIIKTTPSKIKEKAFYKKEFPYIPSLEKQKVEINFIKLIKTLIKSKENKNVRNNFNENIFTNNKTTKEDPYKPKGYNYYNYSREHPELIKDDKQYLKIVQELNFSNDNNENYSYKRCLSDIYETNNNYLTKYKNIEIPNIKIALDKGKNLNNIKFNNTLESNNLKIKSMNQSNSKNILNDNKLYNNKVNDTENDKNDHSRNTKIFNSTTLNKMSISDNNIDILPLIKSDNFKIKKKDSDNNTNNNYFNQKTFLSKKDYNLSDIFNLKEDNYTKQKTSEQYLFKNNYKPMKIKTEKKTSINEVGWFPKDFKNHSRISISSVDFNILCPNLKSISPTKKDIDILNHNKTFKSNLLSEFIDKCKPGDTELRKDYKEQLEENKNIFHRKNYCASYNDLHHGYKGLVLDLF